MRNNHVKRAFGQVEFLSLTKELDETFDSDRSIPFQPCQEILVLCSNTGRRSMEGCLRIKMNGHAFTYSVFPGEPHCEICI